MPQGVYQGHEKYEREKPEEVRFRYITEIRNSLKRFKISPEGMEHILGIFERMPLRQIKSELRMLENPDAYKNSWRLI